MIHFKTFDDLARDVASDDLGKWNRRVPIDLLEMRRGKLKVQPHRCGTIVPLELSELARKNLCDLIGVPASYFARCPPPLQDIQANYWLREFCKRDEREQLTRGATEPAAVLLRCNGNHLRAMLSSDYPCFDHSDLVKYLKPKRRRWLIASFALTAGSLHLTICLERSSRKVTDQVTLLAGCQLENSETSEAVIAVRPVLVIDPDGYLIGCPTAETLLIVKEYSYDSKHAFASALDDTIDTAFIRATELLNLIARYPPQASSKGRSKPLCALERAAALSKSATTLSGRERREQELIAGQLLFGEALSAL